MSPIVVVPLVPDVALDTLIPLVVVLLVVVAAVLGWFLRGRYKGR